MRLDLCAKWYVRDGYEFFSTRDNPEDEIDPEGFLHGRRIINPSALPNEEENSDMLPKANVEIEEVADLDQGFEETDSSILRSDESGIEHKDTPRDMGGCPFSELIGDRT